MKRAQCAIVRACSWLTVPAGAWIVVLAVAGMVWAPGLAWGQSAVWLPQGATTGNIYYNGGNVGIGTPSPGAPFHVVGTGATPQVIVHGSSAAGVPTGITFRIDATDMWTFTGTSDPADSYGYNFAFRQLGSPRLFFRWNGNVGIGTTAPQYKLAVNGTIGAKEVIVTNTGWPDYVFRPGYRLRPLSEVGAYIRVHHRLPEMPSEAEVKAKGVSVGDTQAKLLAKIEELTLHLIQQEQRIAQLEARLAGR